MSAVWKKMQQHMQAILMIAAIIGVCGGAATYFAKASDFNELAASYKYDKVTQRHNAVQERIWALEAMCKNNPSQCTAQVKAEIQHLILELEELKRELAKGS